MNQSNIVTTALGSGACAAIATTAAIGSCGRHENVSPWAAFNAVSHIAWGHEAAGHTEPSLKYSATGIGLNAAAMLMWGGVYACMAGRRVNRSPARALAAGIATAATAYVVDYHVVPERLTPGFETRLSNRSLFFVYACLAVGLSVGGLLTEVKHVGPGAAAVRT